MKIYLLPGLGADARMYLPQMKVLNNCEVLEHLNPNKHETLQEYALRLVPKIDTTEKFCLVGTSLGGMLAIELSRHVTPQKVILIATIKDRSEMPGFIRAMKHLKLHKLLKGERIIDMNTLLANRLNNRGDDQIATLLSQMAASTNPRFIEWAIDAVVNWHPAPLPQVPFVHLHGTNDRLFPISRIKNAIPVQGGTHVMNISSSNSVNELLLKHLTV